MMMHSFGKRVDVPGGTRKAVRQKVALTAAATTLGGSRSVSVSDLTGKGARLSGRSLPKDGRQILLKVGKLGLLGQVIWSGEEDCGIEFDETVDEATLHAIQAEGSLGEIQTYFMR
jgi:hypothetical protein